jgi:cytochrome c peroxidase
VQATRSPTERPLTNIRMRASFSLIALGLMAFAGGCGHSGESSARPIGATIVVPSPLGLPPVPVPANNPETAEGIALGRRLFYEKRLSADTSLACSSCHDPRLGFSDARKHSVGVGGKTGTRNAPTLINAAYTPLQFWDGRASSLEDQAGGPMSNAVEMNQSHEVSVSKLQADPTYRADFERAFGPGPVTIGKITKALAGFERTLISGNSPFDRYQYGGDKAALSSAALRGFAIFIDEKKGNCGSCHTIGEKYALFTDGKFHNIGVGVNDEGNLTDLGRYSESKQEAEKGAFKTPTLRNIAKSAPYMHDGSLKSLSDVVDYYAGGGNSNPYLDDRIKHMHLSGPERLDLVAFLEALTGDEPSNAGPPDTARSGLSK